MLQIKNIVKQYKTGDLVQNALNGVSVNLRDNEFVAVLGPSGSGKTTFLNIIGGLDRYDSGNLIINGVPTDKYKDKNWDSYRNHTVGFVFQNYYLIPHQSVLANVELALTISGVSKKERRNRAKEALTKVGLAEHMHKRPNQMSGGQMQRVAIARALINNPDILLADEPTGALDTKTSVQVMHLLKEVAKDRLVVMVTHNPELAVQYATRIIKLQDGEIIGDSNPYEPNPQTVAAEAEAAGKVKDKNQSKSKMGFLTSLSLSFNNLRTKKGRTILTSFAGSIGIIGIALILAISTGVNNYIEYIQKDTMASYPISIDAYGMDLSSMFTIGREEEPVDEDRDPDKVYSRGGWLSMMSQMNSSISENNLEAFKKYIDNEDSEINKYIGENGVVYEYSPVFDVYAYDPEGVFINTDGSFTGAMNATMQSDTATYTMNMGGASFAELTPGRGGEGINQMVFDNYDLVYGHWPEEFNDVVVVLDSRGEMSIIDLYTLGYLPESGYLELANSLRLLEVGQEIDIEEHTFTYEEMMDQTFYLLPQAELYTENEDGTFDSIDGNRAALSGMVGDMLELNVCGIIRQNEDADYSINGDLAYTRELTKYIASRTDESPVVTAQRENPDVNVLTGITFSAADEAQKAEDTKTFVESMSNEEKANFMVQIMSQYGAEMTAYLSEMTEDELAASLDTTISQLGDQELAAIYDVYISNGTYDQNMNTFGVVDFDKPTGIDIYADSFEDKDHIVDCIDDYNESVPEEDQIVYTDYVGLIMSSITTIVNVISYVLIAFVAVSLVVSSIMIGIITYISVLERTKEIGILRAIGATKHNISQVFNAETFIIGLLAGLFGIGIAELMLIPINAIIHSIADTNNVNGVINVAPAIILIVLSTVLTLIGGFIPSKKAARMDPVAALRTE